MRMVIDPKSQITAFWAPFLLLHLGGPDTITAFIREDNEQWLRQFVRLCIQVGLVGYIYYMVLLENVLWTLAVGKILVGLMKYAERNLCLYLASKGQLRDSMLLLPPPKEEEGYQVEMEVCEVPAPEIVQVNSGQTSNRGNATTLFKPLFLGFIRYFGNLDDSRRMFMNDDMDSRTAFKIVEIELGFMYDLLFTKGPSNVDHEVENPDPSKKPRFLAPVKREAA